MTDKTQDGTKRLPFLPEDRIIDPVAVSMVAQGRRPIRLTRRELAEAVGQLSGMSAPNIAAQLKVPVNEITEITGRSR